MLLANFFGEVAHPQALSSTDLAEDPGNQRPTAPSARVAFETNEGTFMNVDVSPDAGSLVFDLLGDLYLMPITGGVPRQITSGVFWDQAPLFSPDGNDVYFISDRHGAKNIWRQGIRGEAAQQITHSAADILGALNWTSGRRWIIAAGGSAEIANAEVSLYQVDPRTGQMAELQRRHGPWLDMDTFTRLRPRLRTFSGVEAPTGRVYFSEASFLSGPEEFVVRLFALDPATGLRSQITPDRTTYSDYAPQISPDGNVLAWLRQYNDRRTEIRIRDLSSSNERPLTELHDADDASYGAAHPERPRYAFTPDGGRLIYWHDGKIWSVRINDGVVKQIPFRVEVLRKVRQRAEPHADDPTIDRQARVVRWPTVSEDGRWLAFSALGRVWIQDLQTGATTRLTCATDFEYMPTISPDGAAVAYVGFSADHPDYLGGRLMVADRRSATVTSILSASDSTYLLPHWSADRKKIAVIREFMTNDGLAAEFGWTEAKVGVFHDVAVAPPSNSRLSLSLSSRYVGFSANGDRLAFSYPRARDEMVLKAGSLNGHGAIEIAVTHGDIIGVVPSPEFDHLLLTARDSSLWLHPLEGPSIELSDKSAVRVGGSGGYYAMWSDRSQFISAIGAKVSFHDRRRPSDLRSKDIRIRIPNPKKQVVFRNARIVTMASDDGPGPIIDTGTIRARGGHISEVGPTSEVSVPDGAVVVDARGMTILPGLIDTHYHRIGGGDGALGVSALKLPNRSIGDASAITFGITTAWEPGGVLDDGSPAVADLQRSGQVLGPRWSHSASGIVGYPWNRLQSYEDARRAVAWQKALGVNVLKEYNTPLRRQRQWLAKAAREAGLGIYSHLQSFDGAMTRLVDGYSGGEHSDLPMPFFRDVTEMMRQTGYVWTPNVIIARGSVGTVPPDLKESAQEQRQSSLHSESPKSTPRKQYSRLDHRTARIAKQVTAASGLDIHIGVSGHNMPGDRLHAEMRYLTLGGMNTSDVLRAATVGNAAKLGLRRYIGSLEPGKVADFLVLEKDPLIDIANAASVRYTVQGGRVYDSQSRELLFEARSTSGCAR